MTVTKAPAVDWRPPNEDWDISVDDHWPIYTTEVKVGGQRIDINWIFMLGLDDDEIENLVFEINEAIQRAVPYVVEPDEE